MQMEKSWFWEGSLRLGGQNSTSARGVTPGCILETTSPSWPLVAPYARRHWNAAIIQDDMQESIVHLLSKIACSFAESRLSHGQRSPQTCVQFCWTSSGDVSGGGLTSHRTSPSSLMHSRRNVGAGSLKQPLAVHQKHEESLSRVPGGEWRSCSLLRLL